VTDQPSLPPYNVGDLAPGTKRMAPAVARNVVPIGDVLEHWLPSRGLVLEIASGTGEHALAFSNRFPTLDWQPSDPDPDALTSIAAWQADGPSNLRSALKIDVQDSEWPIEEAVAILCVNMVHISPWRSSLGLLDGAARLLPTRAPLILYGPWLVKGEKPAPSNLAFDQSLKQRNPEWGLRFLGDFRLAAERHGFRYVDRVDMPSNNLMLRFDRA
jgi:hypothetical protein